MKTCHRLMCENEGAYLLTFQCPECDDFRSYVACTECTALVRAGKHHAQHQTDWAVPEKGWMVSEQAWHGLVRATLIRVESV